MNGHARRGSANVALTANQQIMASFGVILVLLFAAKFPL